MDIIYKDVPLETSQSGRKIHMYIMRNSIEGIWKEGYAPAEHRVGEHGSLDGATAGAEA